MGDEMSEELLVVICLLVGIICGAPLGYLLGRYRIKFRKVVLHETRLNGFQEDKDSSVL